MGVDSALIRSTREESKLWFGAKAMAAPSQDLLGPGAQDQERRGGVRE